MLISLYFIFVPLPVRYTEIEKSLKTTIKNLVASVSIFTNSARDGNQLLQPKELTLQHRTASVLQTTGRPPSSSLDARAFLTPANTHKKAEKQTEKYSSLFDHATYT